MLLEKVGDRQPFRGHPPLVDTDMHQNHVPTQTGSPIHFSETRIRVILAPLLTPHNAPYNIGERTMQCERVHKRYSLPMLKVGIIVSDDVYEMDINAESFLCSKYGNETESRISQLQP